MKLKTAKMFLPTWGRCPTTFELKLFLCLSFHCLPVCPIVHSSYLYSNKFRVELVSLQIKLDTKSEKYKDPSNQDPEEKS